MRGPPVISITVKDFALVTHAVPAERVRRQLPDCYTLETAPRDETLALVSATCFLNQDFRPAGIGFPRHTFYESTYRTYVSHKGRRGVYFFGRFLATRLAWASQRPLARDTYEADFDVATRVHDDGYLAYGLSASSARGETSFTLEATRAPRSTELFASAAEHVDFITYRLHGFYTAPFGGQGHMPVGHPRMRAVGGRMESGRFDLWNRLGILADDEVQTPHSVLVVREVPFRLYAPRPLGSNSETAEPF